MNPYLDLAKKTIETYIAKGKIIVPAADLPKELLSKKSGVFVSLHKNHKLRGCIGTFMPIQENIAEEIIHNAIAAATQDPRFQPVSQDEIQDLDISIDILSSPCLIHNTHELNPKKYGVVVKTSDGRTGLLLPDLAGVDTVEQQLSIACQKAMIDYKREKYQIFSFTVERHKA